MPKLHGRALCFVGKLICFLAIVCGASDALAHAHDDSHGHETIASPNFIPLNLGSTTPIEGKANPKSGAAPLRFGVVGDIQGNVYTAQLSAGMLNQNLDLALYPGDLINSGGNPSPGDSWDDFIDNTVGVFDAGGQDILVYVVPGNHDLPSGLDVAWQNTFGTYPAQYGGGPWIPDSPTIDGIKGIDQMDYYFDVGTTRIISVTTDSQLRGTRHPAAYLPWFEKVLNLADTKSKDHVFIMTHHPITFDVYDGSGGVNGAFWQIMVNSGAPIHGLFVGHWHQYQPGQPDPYNQDIWEMIVGSGNTGFSGHAWQNKIGYTVIEVDGAEVTAEFYIDEDSDGDYDDKVDSFKMVSASSRPTGLVAQYSFSDNASNLDTAPSGPSGGAYPLLGKENHGDYVNGASISGGKLTLDGVNDFATGRGIGDYNMNILRDLTLSLKVKVDSLTSHADGNTLLSYTGYIGYGTDYDEILNQPYNLRIRSDNKLVMMWELGHSVGKEFVSSSAASELTDGSEHEIQAMRDADKGEVRFFVDGVQLGATLLFDEQSELPTGGQQGFLRIGANFDEVETTTGYFHGVIDDVELWNEVNPNDYLLVISGDFDADSDVDSVDWGALLSGLGMDLSGLTAAEAYVLGDITGNLTTDFDDIILFRDAYGILKGIVPPWKKVAPVSSVPRAGTKPSQQAGSAVSKNLNTNLVRNPGFEDLNLAVTEPQYSLPLILDWQECYAQRHDASGWANAYPLSSGETYYYAGDYNTFQEIDLSTSDIAAAIASGFAEFNLSAYFSSWSSTADHAELDVIFMDAGGFQVGSETRIIGTDFWVYDSATGAIPLGAVTARISITVAVGLMVMLTMSISRCIKAPCP